MDDRIYHRLLINKMRHIELVNTESRLVEVVGHISRTPRVAVDLESNGFFRYHERICLVQFSSDDTAFLVDPLAIDNLQVLGDLFGDCSVEKVFHAADYDIRSIDRDWGFRISSLFDTSIAAALTGSQQLSLQSVVEECAGSSLVKRRNLQRSDWTLRPLSPESLEYAADDVLYLLKVRETLSARLRKLSRFSWAKEEFERMEKVRYTHPDRGSEFLSIKGSRDLDGRGLAVLRSLSRFREQEAIRLDRPLFKVISDSVLVELSSSPMADLTTVKGLGRYGRPPANRGLRTAINEGIRSSPVTRPIRTVSPEKLSAAERARVRDRLSTLKMWRSQLGSDLKMDPSLLWPTVSLERLARCPAGLHSELVSPDVRSWQSTEFAPALRKVLAAFR